MYKTFRFAEKFEFIECTITRKFNGKLCKLDIQMVRIPGNIRIH